MGLPSRAVQVLVATMGCPSARGDLGVAVRLGKMVIKNPAIFGPKRIFSKVSPEPAR